jgi:hypothetical protein
MMNDGYLDEPVQIPPNGVRASASAIRALCQATGRSFGELLNDDEEATKMQAMAFVILHKRAVRLGHLPAPSVLWEQAGLVEFDLADPSAVLDG